MRLIAKQIHAEFYKKLYLPICALQLNKGLIPELPVPPPSSTDKSNRISLKPVTVTLKLIKG